jgi:vanillate O-demethylase monooxygenase subunit
MIESDIWPALRAYWHPVAYAHEVQDDKPHAVQLLGERLAVCKLGGRYQAFYDLCIHRGTPISLGWIEGDEVLCAYHGWSYDISGQCTRIPSIPAEHPIPKKACLTAYPTEQRYGIIWVSLSDEPVVGLPEIPEFEDPSYRVFLRQWKRWQGSAARVIENFVDQAHFAWVHENILGTRDDALMPEFHLECLPEEMTFHFDNPADEFHPNPHVRSYRLKRPFIIHQRKVQPDGLCEVYLVAACPHTEKESTRFMQLCRNYDLDEPEVTQGPVLVHGDQILSSQTGEAGQGHIDTQETIFAQDHVIVSQQRPEELPLDLTEELHVKGPDTICLNYRRWMRELGVE